MLTLLPGAGAQAKPELYSLVGVPLYLELVVFSKSGFADSAKREADRAGNVTLLGLADLLG